MAIPPPPPPTVIWAALTITRTWMPAFVLAFTSAYTSRTTFTPAWCGFIQLSEAYATYPAITAAITVLTCSFAVWFFAFLSSAIVFTAIWAAFIIFVTGHIKRYLVSLAFRWIIMEITAVRTAVNILFTGTVLWYALAFTSRTTVRTAVWRGSAWSSVRNTAFIRETRSWTAVWIGSACCFNRKTAFFCWIAAVIWTAPIVIRTIHPYFWTV